MPILSHAGSVISLLSFQFPEPNDSSSYPVEMHRTRIIGSSHF